MHADGELNTSDLVEIKSMRRLLQVVYFANSNLTCLLRLTYIGVGFQIDSITASFVLRIITMYGEQKSRWENWMIVWLVWG
jgi:hypothetical protein